MTETHNFGADIPEVMKIIVNSLYSSKELFLRELISNSSDACSKFVSKKSELDENKYDTEYISDMKITVIPNKEDRTLTIKDNGIGMTKADLISFLGSIATSGTQKFKSMLSNKQDKENLQNMIGQFGLGFYSAYLVADTVDVITKHPTDSGYKWSSTCGQTTYTIEDCEVDFKHGTLVVLHLKEGENEFLESSKLISLIKTHSNFIKYKIAVVVEKEVKEDKKDDGVTEIDGDEEEKVEEVEEKKEENTEKSEEQKKEKVMVKEEQIVNSEISIWSQNLKKIPEEDLKKFYKTISNDYEDYLACESWHFEGVVDLKILLFIPKKGKLGFFETQHDKPKNIKLFNSNVFVTDDLGKDTLPEWMQFVYGAISSPDFPMNISREFLQGKSIMKLLKSKLPKCISEMISKIQRDEEKYAGFYKEFSHYLKLAVRHYSGTEQEPFIKFLMYPTNTDPEKMITFDEYLRRVPEDNKQILYLTALNKKDCVNSIYLEGVKDKLVFLMHEAVDEFMLQNLKNYREQELQNITIEGVVPNSEISEEDTNSFKPVVDKLTDLFKDSLEKVILSNRSVQVPATILIGKYGPSATMETLLKSQPGYENNPMMQMMTRGKKILEINIGNPIIKMLKELNEQNNEERFNKVAEFVKETAMVGAGYPLENKTAYVSSLYSLMAEAFKTN